MGDAIEQIQNGLGRAIDSITASITGSQELTVLFGEIDAFVRAVISSKRQLEDLQRANLPEDAGE